MKTVMTAVQLADDWSSARHAYPRSYHAPAAHREPPRKETPSDSSPQPTDASTSTFKCHQCGEAGHIRPRCPKNPRAFKDGSSSTVRVGFCWEARQPSGYCVAGTINGSRAPTILRDTGCSSLIVSEEALPDVDTTNCRKVTVCDYLGRPDTFPVVRCYLRCPSYDGWAEAIRAPIKFATALHYPHR